ncbi:MAG: hypothetical protein ACYC3L_15180 [Gemmatimonadaceae bacterium]
MKRILSAGVLALVISGSALAQSGSQSPTSGPGGGGAGVGGMLGAFLPSPSGVGGSGASLGSRMSNVRGNGPAAVAMREVGGALTGATGAVGTLSASLTSGGVPATAANALAQALGAFGAAPTLANLQAAVEAYNAAVRATPAGTRPSASMRAARNALRTLSGRASRT